MALERAPERTCKSTETRGWGEASSHPRARTAGEGARRSVRFKSSQTTTGQAVGPHLA